MTAYLSSAWYWIHEDKTYPAVHVQWAERISPENLHLIHGIEGVAVILWVPSWLVTFPITSKCTVLEGMSSKDMHPTKAIPSYHTFPCLYSVQTEL